VVTFDTEVWTLLKNGVKVSEEDKSGGAAPEPISQGELFVNGAKFQAPIYQLDLMPRDFELKGPALIMCGTSTTVVEPDWKLKIDQKGDIYLHRTDDHMDDGNVTENVD